MKTTIRILIIILMTVIALPARSQLLPGLERDQVMSYMAESYREFVLRVPPNVNELDFIKYEHVSGDMTLLVFMSEEGYCRFTRLMVDNYYIDEMVDRFNSDFKSSGDREWIARRGIEELSVTLQESEWMFTVEVRIKENEQ